MVKALALVMIAWAAIQAAHAGETRPQPTGIAPPTRIPNVEQLAPAPVGEPVALTVLPRAVRRAVVADAAKRFKVAENLVVLTRAEQVTWSDGSMGCAEPGQMYTQMLVPGFRVIAKTSGGELAYHTDARGHVVSCAGSSRLPGKPGLSGSEPRTMPPVQTPPDR